ncbi:MAG TPA: LysR family transcriptional regulator, partial [Proteobacteria bacterium]|nr:LysR family transcriptional regulator [Pseudomonadota bacterium]
MIELRLKVWLEKGGETVFGLGRYELLRLTDELGSLHKAAEALGISYRSAWGKIRDTERRLGFELLKRKIGGKRGGGSVLTDRARALLKEYERLEDR